jgi:hypothetical protein
MADTTTTNLGLTLPELPAVDVWGAKLNASFAAIDAFAGGHWTVLTNQDPSAPELIFDGDGEAVAVWVEGE